MRKHSFWTALCCCIFLSLNLSAQDKLCLANEIRQVKVTDLSPSSVKYLSADDPTQTVELPLNKILVLFNVQGRYLVPGQIDATSATGKSALSRFFSISGDERNTDELISKTHKVLDVNISNEDDQFIYWDNDGKMAKADLAAVIYNNGTPKFFCTMDEAAAILGACKSTPLNLSIDPNMIAASQPAKQAIPDPALTSKTTSDPMPTPKQPAADPKPTPKPVTTASTAAVGIPLPPSTSKPAAATTSATVNTSDDVTGSANADPAMKRKIDSLLGGHHISREEFAEKCKQKTVRFTDYMKIFCDKQSPNAELNKATEGAVSLFVNEDAKVEVSSANRDDVKRYKIRAYLGRLKLLPYDKIEVKWINIQYIDDLKLDQDGVLHGTVAFEQEFKAYKDNALVYSDVTEKVANVILKTYNNSSEGQVTRGWDVLLADIGVSGTRPL
jgi:hypothetical protein